MKVTVTNFYPEEIRTKKDASHYDKKGTCEVGLSINGLDLDIKNITYRIEHGGKIHIKPPFRVHSNKKAGVKPKLVHSIIFRDSEIWVTIEGCIREELAKMKPQPTKKPKLIQLNLFEWS